MKMLRPEEKLPPMGPFEFGGVILFALFGLPLAMHLLASLLQ
jgi:hypothetical protein